MLSDSLSVLLPCGFVLARCLGSLCSAAESLWIKSEDVLLLLLEMEGGGGGEVSDLWLKPELYPVIGRIKKFTFLSVLTAHAASFPLYINSTVFEKCH